MPEPLQVLSHWRPGGLRLPSCLPEPLQVDDVERRDVVGLALQVLPPEALGPEPEPVHVAVGVAEGGVAVGRALRGRGGDTLRGGRLGSSGQAMSRLVPQKGV